MLNGPSLGTETSLKPVDSSNHRAAARLCVTVCWLQGPSDRLAMSLKALTDDEKSELKEQFTVLDKEESGFINLSELKEALDLAGFKVRIHIYTVSTQYLHIMNTFSTSITQYLHSIYTISTQYLLYQDHGDPGHLRRRGADREL